MRVMDSVRRRSFWQGVFRLADPKISLTSVAAVVLGAGVAFGDVGRVDWTWLAVTLVALFGLEVAKNASGDVVDYDSGTDLAVTPEDRTDFSGGKRVLVDGLLDRRETWAVFLVFAAVGLATGLAIVIVHEPRVFWIGVVGCLLGWSYHGWPLRLAYRGLGELDVAVCYGPLAVLGVYLVQTHALSWQAVAAGAPLGLLVGSFLWVNEFPDYRADASAGKRNLVVRLGRPRAAAALLWIQVITFLLVLALPLAGVPRGAWLGAIAFAPVAWAVARVRERPDDFYRHHAAQPAFLLAFLLYATGAGIGIAWLGGRG